MNETERLKQKEIKLKAASRRVVIILNDPTKTEEQKRDECWEVLRTWDSSQGELE